MDGFTAVHDEVLAIPKPERLEGNDHNVLDQDSLVNVL